MDELIAILKFVVGFGVFFGAIYLIEEYVRTAIWRRRIRKFNESRKRR